jgi:dihydropyrimidinase
MNVDYDPFEGWEVRGAPRTVLSRGASVFVDGKVVSQPGHGRFVKRSLFPAAREPALA